MSLIGPRPLPPAEALLLPPALVARRGLMRPGMTGLWQVSGRSLIPTLEARLALDLHYVDNWSPGLDLLIAVKTVPAVLSGRGAW